MWANMVYPEVFLLLTGTIKLHLCTLHTQKYPYFRCKLEIFRIIGA